jgi:hypothetical protein
VQRLARLSMHCAHSSAPIAAARARVEKVTHVSLSLGFDLFLPTFFCLRVIVKCSMVAIFVEERSFV